MAIYPYMLILYALTYENLSIRILDHYCNKDYSMIVLRSTIYLCIPGVKVSRGRVMC